MRCTLTPPPTHTPHSPLHDITGKNILRRRERYSSHTSSETKKQFDRRSREQKVSNLSLLSLFFLSHSFSLPLAPYLSLSLPPTLTLSHSSTKQQSIPDRAKNSRSKKALKAEETFQLHEQRERDWGVNFTWYMKGTDKPEVVLRPPTPELTVAEKERAWPMRYPEKIGNTLDGRTQRSM